MRYLVLVCLLYTCSVFAQQENDSVNVALQPWYQIVKVNGVKYIGKIISDDGREVLIDTKEIGRIYIKKAEIASMKPLSGDKQTPRDVGEASIFPRYFLSSNSLSLKRGTNYAGIHLLGVDFTIPVSNTFSLGIFTSWIGSPFGLNLKNNFKTSSPNLNFSLGLIAGSSSYLNSFEGYGGTFYGGVTVGDSKLNVSFSAGYSILNSGFSKRYKVEYTDTTDIYYTYPMSVNVRYTSPQKSSMTLSLAGFASVSSKVSLLLDAVMNVGSVVVPSAQQYGAYPDYSYSGGDLAYVSFFEIFNIFNGSYYNTISIPNMTLNTTTKTTLLIFPAIRFQFRENKAFQLTLGSTHTFMNGVRKSYPFPMCSWLIRF